MDDIIPLTITYGSYSKILFYDVNNSDIADHIIQIADQFIHEYEDKYDLRINSDIIKIRKYTYDALSGHIELLPFAELFNHIITYPFKDNIQCYFLLNGAMISYTYKFVFANLKYTIHLSIRYIIDDFIDGVEELNDIFTTYERNTYRGILYTKIIKILCKLNVEIPTYYDVWPGCNNIGIDNDCKKILRINWD